jgi:hypothetical protein
MTESISEIFDRIYCINLDRRKDRLELFQEETKRWGLEGIRRYPGMDGNDLPERYKGTRKFPRSAIGLVMTNIKILEECLSDQVSSVLILEDDVVFTPRMRSAGEILGGLPENWDSLYLGGNHNSHKGVSPPKKVSDGLCKIHHTFSTHAVGFKGDFIQKVLDRIRRVDSPLDVAYTDLQKIHNFYCFYPALAVQRSGYSDIQNQTMDYSKWIK